MGSRQARRLLCHLRGPSWGSASGFAQARPTNRCLNHPRLRQHAPRQKHAGPYFGTRPNLSQFKDSAARFSSPSTPLHAHPAVSEAASACVSGAVKLGFVSWYLRMLDARPILTKSITAGVIFIAADLSSQTVTLGPSDSYDLIRTSRMAAYGMLISGPSLHFWFNFLSKILPKRDVINTLKKMFLGQTLYGPIINTVFFSLNAFLQGETGSEIIARLKRDLPPTFLNGLIYWPMCDFITFRFVPVRLQPLVSNSFSFIWTIYITYMASLKKAATVKVAEH